MPIYTIYTLQHVILLATQIISHIRRERSQSLKQLSLPHLGHQFEIPSLITSQQPEMKDVHMKEVCTSPHVEDLPNVAKKNKKITDLKFQSNGLCENVHDVSLEDKTNVEHDEIIENVHVVFLEDKTSVEDDEIIDLSKTFKEVQRILGLSINPNCTIEIVQQNQIEEVEVINMILLICVKAKKVVLEENLIKS